MRNKRTLTVATVASGPKLTTFTAADDGYDNYCCFGNRRFV